MVAGDVGAGSPSRPLVLGHLGNSIAGLRSVVDSGADGVEFDVRRTADGALVLHHDAMTAGGAVSELRRRDLPSSIPDLDEALEVCSGLLINIEVKNLPTDPHRDHAERAAVEVAEMISARALQRRVIVSAFTLRTIDIVRAVDPQVETALLSLPRGDQLARAAKVWEHGHGGVHPHFRGVTVGLVSDARQRGGAIRPWAVDEPAAARAMQSLGVDAVISDDPLSAIRALARLGPG